MLIEYLQAGTTRILASSALSTSLSLSNRLKKSWKRVVTDHQSWELLRN